MSGPNAALADYRVTATRLADELAAIDPSEPVRLGKRTSNLFRLRQNTPVHRLDVTGLDQVFTVDPDALTADVGGMTTYEHLVDATLPYGLVPLVVPQLRTITLGGAVTGLGIESPSFRTGLPHESVIEEDILTGDGQLVTARPDGEHRDLYTGFPNSYGSLGYALRLRIQLERAAPYVHLRHLRFDDAAAYAQALADICAAGDYLGEKVDFVDGTVFSAHRHVLTLGSYTDRAPYVSDYTGQQIYYQSVGRRREDFLTIHDYLWRWDTDWFWCSRAFGVQDPRFRRIIPRRLLRSEVYWKVANFERRHHYVRRLDKLRGKPDIEEIVQDIEVPVDKLPAFLEFFHREIGISPVWVCPLRQARTDLEWDLYKLKTDVLYVNVGFWSSVDLSPGQSDGTHNRLIEREVERLGGRKSLYSTAFYSEDEFWQLYNGEAYAALKKRYDPANRFADLYAKTVGRS
ncbi:FAD-binding protein [Fodinicola acaciae]|uniref:FAD-binding protein n=1 Tax=Fodinicola acaciae TaxID=2681555 RepID=UPI0013CF81E7|nr:FAD-binding oxidoreductase [Fodinicola acaciae]